VHARNNMSSRAGTNIPKTPDQAKGGFISNFLPWGRGGAAPEAQAPSTPMMMTTTTSEDFAAASPSMLDRTAAFTQRLSSREQVEVDLITHLIESYFNIVREKIMDSVPKTIMHFLVNYVKTALQNEMVTRLWKRELFDELLAEDPQIASQRVRAAEMLSALNRAFTIVTEVSML